MRVLKISLVLVAVVLTMATLFVWDRWAGGCVTSSMSPGDSFDASGWKDGTVSTRSRMLGSLLRDGRLIGKTADDIAALLGPAESNTNDRASYIVATYAADKGCGLNRHAILNIDFADNGVAVKASVTQD